MDDLTVIYITASRLPDKWQAFQLSHLLKSIGDTALITVSRKPMGLGENIIDRGIKSYWNMYSLLLQASLLAKTPFVAVAEDDTLYTQEHFSEFRPPMDKVSYDRSRWSLFSWDNMYCMRQRVSNCSLIAPRELLVEALTERKNKYPNGCPDKLLGEVGRPIVERRLGVTLRGSVEWYCRNPIVQLNHPTGTDQRFSFDEASGRVMVKKHGQIKAYDIPYWGKAEDIIAQYKN
jgi:hypothetical protein